MRHLFTIFFTKQNKIPKKPKNPKQQKTHCFLTYYFLLVWFLFACLSIWLFSRYLDNATPKPFRKHNFHQQHRDMVMNIRTMPSNDEGPHVCTGPITFVGHFLHFAPIRALHFVILHRSLAALGGGTRMPIMRLCQPAHLMYLEGIHCGENQLQNSTWENPTYPLLHARYSHASSYLQ